MTSTNFFAGGVDRGAYKDVSPQQLGLIPDEVRFIDVRQPDEFRGDLGHLNRAELVPLETLGEASSAWEKDAPLLLICRSGARSSMAAGMLAGAGFTRLGNLAGGMMAVRREGL